MRRMKKYVILVMLIVSGGFLCFYAFTFAKYVSNSVWDYYLKSKGFYFSSDYLDSSTVKNVDNLWNGGSVSFNLKNNLNQAVVTTYDIDYRVTCTIEGDATSHAECDMNDTGSNTQDGVLSSSQICSNTTGDGIDVSLYNKTECELGGYDWINLVATKDIYFDIISTDPEYELSDVIVRVTATSLAPYSKTLSGEFILHKSELETGALDLSYNNYSNYDRLVVSNSYSADKCVSVTWDANKLAIGIDNSEVSSYLTDVNGYINEIKFNISAKGSMSYMFYRKPLNAIYDVSEFSIEESTGC